MANAYLKLALRFENDYFNYILAVTFTNKATQEMKERILQYLDAFSKGKSNSLSKEIANDLHLTATQLKQRSESLLSTILHQYDRFSVSTIDSFFQKVLRSFVREAGLMGGFRLEMENELVLREVLAQLMDELGENKQLTEWVIAFSRNQLNEGKNWNILKALESFAGEVFKEHFKVIESQLIKSSKAHGQYQKKMEILQQTVAVFENSMQQKARSALTLLHKSNITADDIKYKDQGTPLKYFLEFSKKNYFPSTGKRIQQALIAGINWYTKEKCDTIKVELADTYLIPILREMIAYDSLHSKRYLSARHVLQNFYCFGLIASIVQKIEAYKHKNNLMLLSDTSQFIQKIIHGSDVPFIYEKIGSYFRHYLMDEFQDTSELQWKNFYPLLKDTLDQGRSSFIVGDGKQSIYRWRGGDPHLLQNEVASTIGKNRVEIKKLNANYRSADHIIQFNNILFKQASKTITEITQQPFAQETFADVEQDSGGRLQCEGYLHLSFMEKNGNKMSWKEKVLSQLPTLIEELQDKKIKLGDIAILTRKKEEGQRIATTFLTYKNTQPKPGYRYDVVSDESLRLDAAPSVRLLLSTMHYLHNPQNAIVRGQLAHQATKGKRPDTAFQQAAQVRMDEILPKKMIACKEELTKLPLYELVEELIRLFELGKEENELAYLQAFQNTVLEFSSQKQNDLPSFLEWWEDVKNKKSIQMVGDTDAIHILTIHKAKGLQFKYVIIPFLNWRLDHEKNPLLWVQSTCKPFDTMGYLAVRYNSRLENTHFSDAYTGERAKIYLDNLNLLYVAFTRAEEGLIAYAPKPSEGQKKLLTVGDLVHDSLLREDSLHTSFNENKFSVGTIIPPDKQILIGNRPLIALKAYTYFDWRTKLTIKKEGEGFFQIDQKEDKTYYGNLLHKTLARVHYKDEIDDILYGLRIQQMLTEAEHKKIANEIKKMIAHPTVATWFERKWEVQTEASILLPTGEQKRIDRVMMENNNAVIIDYKTGAKRAQDQTQVKTYTELLAKMGYACTGYLLYLQSMQIVAIK